MWSIDKFLIQIYRISVFRRFVNKYIARRDGMFWSNVKREIMLKYYQVKIGYGSYGAMFNIGAFKPGTQIGNYCSFAQNIYQFNANHPFEKFTTHPILYHKDFTKSGKEELIRKNLIIGHDVWIGQGVILLPGCCSIGNGAIIGAGSIVTKDVLPYTIVAGNPAKKIKMRFTSKVIDKLENSKWWELNKDELIENQEQYINIINE